jgi:hypothetical protein
MSNTVAYIYLIQEIYFIHTVFCELVLPPARQTDVIMAVYVFLTNQRRLSYMEVAPVIL